MTTKLRVILSKNDKISNQTLCIKGSNNVNAAINKLLADGYRILHAVASDISKNVESNRRVIKLLNYSKPLNK